VCLNGVLLSSSFRPALASYPMGTRAISAGLNWPGREADHSPSSSAEVKNDGAVPALPHLSAWPSALTD
jgi:hypothetical protein